MFVQSTERTEPAIYIFITTRFIAIKNFINFYFSFIWSKVSLAHVRKNFFLILFQLRWER